MTSIVIKKNMFMKHRYGLFKSTVYRNMQLNSFVKHSKCILNNQKNNLLGYKLKNAAIAIEILEYLSRTKDIWWQLDALATIIKNKVFELVNEMEEAKMDEVKVLQQFLIGFGYICTYTKRNVNMCCKRLE